MKEVVRDYIYALILVLVVGVTLGFFSSLFTSCGLKQPEVVTVKGDPGSKGDPGISATSPLPCVVTKNLRVTTVACPGSDPVTILDGLNGADGTSCSATTLIASTDLPNGGAFIDCGSTTVVVSNGVDGSVGQTGAPGVSGQNSTPVVPVQFCPGQTSYPSSFPEFGFLINGKLFAVYWDGRNSWMAEIPPGRYMSTSTTAPCDFTVKADGSIGN